MNYKLPANLYKPEKELRKGIFSTSLDGLLYIEQSMHADERGFFSEVSRIPEIEEVTEEQFIIKQINHARSEKNVVRGIHAEGWNKLIYVSTGLAFVVIADVRAGSLTFRQKEYFLFGDYEEALQGSLYLPSGIGNSICVLEGPVDYIYAVDKLYVERDPEGDKAVSLFDPGLAIEWPIERETMILSQRDLNGKVLP